MSRPLPKGFKPSPYKETYPSGRRTTTFDPSLSAIFFPASVFNHFNAPFNAQETWQALVKQRRREVGHRPTEPLKSNVRFRGSINGSNVVEFARNVWIPHLGAYLDEAGTGHVYFSLHNDGSVRFGHEPLVSARLDPARKKQPTVDEKSNTST